MRIHSWKFIQEQDTVTVQGGTLGNLRGQKIAELYKKAIGCHCPVIGINDSGGACIQEGVIALAPGFRYYEIKIWLP